MIYYSFTEYTGYTLTSYNADAIIRIKTLTTMPQERSPA